MGMLQNVLKKMKEKKVRKKHAQESEEDLNEIDAGSNLSKQMLKKEYKDAWR